MRTVTKLWADNEAAGTL